MGSEGNPNLLQHRQKQGPFKETFSQQKLSITTTSVRLREDGSAQSAKDIGWRRIELIILFVTSCLHWSMQGPVLVFY